MVADQMTSAEAVELPKRVAWVFVMEQMMKVAKAEVVEAYLHKLKLREEQEEVEEYDLK